MVEVMELQNFTYTETNQKGGYFSVFLPLIENIFVGLNGFGICTPAFS